MKISVAKTAGFCFGVRRAVDMVLEVSHRTEKSIFTYGPLIHNPQVLAMLEEKKIYRLDTIPKKGSGIVFIRAHGVPPDDQKALKDAGFTVINATCPRVVRVQMIIDKYSKKGYATIIAGDQKHPEVIGLLGYASVSGHAITFPGDLAALPTFEKAVLVAQTTQNTAFFSKVRTWCENNAPHYKIFDTICGSTERRQNEIRNMAKINDAVVVFGGKQSGNTKRLAQIASEAGKPTTHIEDPEEIDFNILSNAKSIAFTAGASTPNWIINDAYRRIEKNLQKKHPIRNVLFTVREFLLKTNLLAAAGAGFLTHACTVLQGFEQNLNHPLIAMLYILSMQLINHLFMVKSDKYNHPDRALLYQNYQSYLWIMALLSGATGLYLSMMEGGYSFIILFFMSLLGLSYNLKIIPQIRNMGKITRIRDIPGSKTILIVLAWGTVTCLLPAVANQRYHMNFLPVFLFATGLIFARTAFFDILAIQGDRISGKETLPTLVGEAKSFKIIQYVLIFDIIVIILSSLSNLLVKRALLFAFIPLIMLFLIKFFKKNSLASGVHREFMVESVLIVTGCLSTVI